MKSNNIDAISRSVRTEKPRNYLFKIESFSLLRQALSKVSVNTTSLLLHALFSIVGTNKDKYDSPHFDAGGYKWKLSLYPNGDKGRGGDGHISLYLALADPKSLPLGKEVHAFVNFFVYDHLRGNYLVLQDGKEKQFHSLKTECGFAKLLPLEIFKDPSKGYLVNDCCVFGVEVFMNKSEIQVGLSWTNNDLNPRESSFTWKIDKFSTLTEMQDSKVFSVGGIKWTLKLFPKGDSRAEGSSLSLFLGVHDPSSFPRGWNIYAEYKLSILDQLDQTHREKTVDGVWFRSTSVTFGYSHFLGLSDLKRSWRGFIVDDTVIIQVKFICISVLNRMT